MYTLDRIVHSAKLLSLHSAGRVVAMKTDNAEYISTDFLLKGGEESLVSNKITPKLAVRLPQNKIEMLYDSFRSTLK